jgi:MerR family mercuric resistance operon transcriptional regulator
MKDVTIAGLAKTAGVGVETIRYYQRRGLLSQPPRTGGSGLGGGIRRYGDQDIRRLHFIRAAQTAGFTLEEIKELIDLDSGHEHQRARDLALKRITALDQKISELQAARSALGRLAQACAATTIGPCPIIAAFDQD